MAQYRRTGLAGRASPDRRCRYGSAAASGRANPGAPARFAEGAYAHRASVCRRRRFPSASGQRAKTAANLGKTGEIAAVAAEEHPQLIVFKHREHHSVRLPSVRLRPEKCWAGVAVSRRPSISVPCHQSNWRIFPAPRPAAGRSPTPSGATNWPTLPSSARMAAWSVVVMIVREDHGADRWQLLDRDRRRVKAFWPGERQRRCPLGEHRIGQPPLAAQLEQHRGMPQTVQATIGCRLKFGARQALNRHRRRRHRAFGFVEKYVPPHAQGGLGQVTRRRRPLIVKAPIAPLWR